MIAKTSPRSAGGVGGVLNALGSRDGFYAMLALFILLALSFAPTLLPVLMLVVAAGSHAYWLARLAYRFLTNRPAAG